MEMQRLLQLAKDNSSLAIKKFERKAARENEITGVSSTAVAKYLERKRKEKEKIEAEEKAARQRRIQARLNASLEKKTKETKKPPEKKIPPEKDLGNVKFKVDKKFRKDPEERKKVTESGNKHKTHRTEEKIIQSKKEKDQGKFERDHSYKNEHRKEVNRTVDTKPKLPSNKRQQKSGNATAGLSFQEIAKLAKTNSEAALRSSDPHKLSLKRALPIKENESNDLDPDRDVRVKIKKKDYPNHKNANHIHEPLNKRIEKERHLKHEKSHSVKSKEISQSGSSEKERHLKSEKYHSVKSNKIRQSSSKYPPEKSNKNKPANKCSLIAETVSSTKTVAGSKPTPYPSNKIADPPRPNRPTNMQNKSRGIAAQNQSIKAKSNVQSNSRGIAAQNKSIRSNSRSARDYEDEFEKEERELLRRRRLFEMQRITGNHDMDEEDLYDDYDLDEDEDDEDDDFIDDSESNIDASKYIRRIFGYDRRKYEDDDDDIDNMEASYSQIEKEELRSARIAKIEDEYEAMKEEEELARKKMKKKK